MDKTQALLAQIGPTPFLTDGGLETHLIFNDGIDLLEYAAFPLLRSEEGRGALLRYFAGFLDEAAALGLGFILDTPTWRASAGWGARMGWQAADIDAINREAVTFAQALRADRPKDRGATVLINGVIGPHCDACRTDAILTATEAEAYHTAQVQVFAGAGVDMVTAVTMSSTDEAIGIAQAARTADVPAVLSFTVETDGRLIGGLRLADAIAQTDAATGSYPAWYGINCAHPDHFIAELTGDHAQRIGLIRANASRKSHAELDNSATLDAGDPLELAMDYARLRQMVPGLRVVGGCCGTDLRHIALIGHRFANRQ